MAGGCKQIYKCAVKLLYFHLKVKCNSIDISKKWKSGFASSIDVNSTGTKSRILVFKQPT